jgi:hypothetical protein
MSTQPVSSGYLDSPRLTPDAVVVYKYAVQNPEWTPNDVIGLVGFDRSRLDAALRALHAAKLFRRSIEPGRRWDVVGPKCALVDLLAEEEAKLRQAHSRLMSTQDELLSLVPGYLDALNRRSPCEAIDVLRGNVSVHRLLAEHTRPDDEDEIWVLNSGHQPADVRWLREFGGALTELPHTTHSRVLLDHSAQANRHTRQNIELIRRNDSEVRTVSCVPFHMVLVNGFATFLSSPDDSQDEVALIRHPMVVGAFQTAFERLWATATPFSTDAAGREMLRDQVRASILAHLTAGEKDEVIARRLGLSVRTCRRHIASIMDELGATGRFQAGVLAERMLFHRPAG